MDKPDSLRLLQYTCPVCGKSSTLGRHFCETVPETKPRPRSKALVKRILVGAVALLAMWLLLWQLIGVLSLYLMGLAALALSIAWGINKLAKKECDEDE